MATNELSICFTILLIVICQSYSSDHDQDQNFVNPPKSFKLVKRPKIVGNTYLDEHDEEYKKANFTSRYTIVNYTMTNDGKPVNRRDFLHQIRLILHNAPEMYQYYQKTYRNVERWLKMSSKPEEFNKYNIETYLMRDNGSIDPKILMFDYHTPLLQARYKNSTEFCLPLYRLPDEYENHTTVPEPYEPPKDLLIGWCNSIWDITIMKFRRHGLVDFGDNKPPKLFAYIAQVQAKLIRTAQVPYPEKKIPFDFLKRLPDQIVRGAYHVPLVANTSLACDPSMIQIGRPMLVEVPLMDSVGMYSGAYEMRLMVPLDISSPVVVVKGYHLNMYQGIAPGIHAGVVRQHYNRVWELESPSKEH